MPTPRARVALFLSATLASTAAVAALAVSAPAIATSNGGALGPSGGAVAGAAPVRSEQAAAQGVRLSGAVEGRGQVSRPELLGFAQKTVTSSYQTSSGRQVHTYTGPLLRAVLQAADPSFTDDRHDPLRFAILVTAVDGFQAVLAWGEIDRELANKRVVLALTEDGKRLARPRLVVPGDAHGARQVYDVDRITLLRLSEGLAAGSAGEQVDETGERHGH